MKLEVVRNKLKLITDRTFCIESIPHVEHMHPIKQKMEYHNYCSHLPLKGMYFIFDKDHNLVHLAKSKSMRYVIKKHISGKSSIGQLRNTFGYLGFIECPEGEVDELSRNIKMLI